MTSSSIRTKSPSRWDTATLISSGKLQADGSDLRVIDANGRLQPHYIESGLNTSSTLIWIRVYHMPGLSTVDLRILTGNAGVENTSSPSETFDLWDDFEGDTPSGISPSAASAAAQAA